MIHVMQKHGKRMPSRDQKKAAGYDYNVQTVGKTDHVAVLVDTSLGQPGFDLAMKCLASAEADFQRVQALFGPIQLPPVTMIVANLGGSQDGTGGAYHYGCGDTVLYCDCSLGRPDRTSALFVAELSEVGQATQAGGWDCGTTGGEGLSRIHAETLYPGALDDYSTAAIWLDGSRPNWVDGNEQTDQDAESNGCAVLFLTWLLSVGYGLDRITQAAAPSLAGTYQTLTGHLTAWEDFSAACAARWPAGQPSGVTTDNPWGAGGGGGGGTKTSSSVITLTGTDPAGTYVLVPIPAGISHLAIDWAKFIAGLLALILGTLGGASVPKAK